jgi:2-methylcitrate dehydratase PrpD
VHELADFVAGARFDAISPAALEQLELRVLDSLGVALGALGAERLVAETATATLGAVLKYREDAARAGRLDLGRLLARAPGDD